MPHLVPLGLVLVHLLDQHKTQPLLLLALLPAPLKLRNPHLRLDVLIIFLVIVRAVLPNSAVRPPTSTAPAAGDGPGASTDETRRAFLLCCLARLLGFALPTTLLLDRRGGDGHC